MELDPLVNIIITNTFVSESPGSFLCSVQVQKRKEFTSKYKLEN
jgi:hypothetical protein